MWHIAFMTVCYKLGVEWHSGQWSRGYALQCVADIRARRDGISLGRICEQLDNNSPIYPKGCEFRNCVAYFLKKMKHHRHNL